MTDPQPTTDSAPRNTSISMPVMALGIIAIAAGAFVFLAWVGTLVGAFLGLDQHDIRQASDFLLAVVVLAGGAALAADWKRGIVAVLAAAAYAAAWRYIGWGLTYAGDAHLFASAAVFYLSPPIAGIAAISAGRARLRSRKASASGTSSETDAGAA